MYKPSCDFDAEYNACARAGAAAFFAGIPDTVTVMNGPQWCYHFVKQYLEKSVRNVDAKVFSSGAIEQDVVYGAADCLTEILHIAKEQTPGLVCIENTCAMSLIGDDLNGIAKQVNFDCPVLCIEGMKGGYREGYLKAVKTFFTNIPLEIYQADSKVVNLLGCTTGYYNWHDDITELKNMLKLAGYEVCACPGAGSTINEISRLTSAALNIVVHEELGLELAELLQQKYHMPYISILPPYGIEASIQWVRSIMDKLNDYAGFEQFEKAAFAAKDKLVTGVNHMEHIWGPLWFDKIVVNGPKSMAIALACALRTEIADTEQMIAVLKETKEASNPYPEVIDTVMTGADAYNIYQDLTDECLVLGNNYDKTILKKHFNKTVIHQNFTMPVYDELVLSTRPFIGLQGALHLTEVLWNKYTGMKSKR